MSWTIQISTSLATSNPSLPLQFPVIGILLQGLHYRRQGGVANSRTSLRGCDSMTTVRRTNQPPRVSVRSYAGVKPDAIGWRLMKF